MRKELEQVREALQCGLNDTDGCELNMSNYHHDDVHHLNNSYVVLFQSIEQALATLDCILNQDEAEMVEAVALEILAGSVQNDPLHDRDKLIRRYKAGVRKNLGFFNSELEPHRRTAKAALRAVGLIKEKE